MKTFKGTKGEWRILHGSSRLETDIFCNDIIIAEVKHYNEGDDDWTQYDPTLGKGRANAKLIAAAPELLEALQLALKVLERDKDPIFSKRLAITNAEKAIEKAL